MAAIHFANYTMQRSGTGKGTPWPKRRAPCLAALAAVRFSRAFICCVSNAFIGYGASVFAEAPRIPCRNTRIDTNSLVDMA